MAALQQIDRVRRDYNRWVANQTLEDFALRFTAKRARRFSSARVGQTALGAISFLALEAIAGSMTLNYGFTNAVAAIAVTAVIIFAAGMPICFYAAEYGVDIDLLTRGAGFGYIGSTITSLIYASFTFILFAIESAIMAIALQLCIGVPLPIGYLVSALAVIPLVTHGISGISRFQLWTQPIWILLNVLPVIAIAWTSPASLSDWTHFSGSQNASNGFNIVFFGAASSAVLAFIVQLGEQVDYLRFLPQRQGFPQRQGRGSAWWLALVAAGPGWVLVGALKLLIGSFLAVYLIRHGLQPSAVDPPHMYAAAFQALTGSPVIALTLTCVFVVVCQLKINVTNAYAGSIAWSNFFARLTHYHPGRVVWLVFNVVLALLVMEVGVFDALERTLAVFSSVAVAWIGAIVADLVINKPLKLSPPGIEFKRAHLYDVNPVGVGAMALAAGVGVTASLGLAGPVVKSLAPFLSLAVALTASPLIALWTGGRYYLARQPQEPDTATETIACCICQNDFEPEDMAHCPAYSGPICSLCCSLDGRCQDLCKPKARLRDQLEDAVGRYVPLGRDIAPRLVDLGFVLVIAGALTGALLAIIALVLSADPMLQQTAISWAVWKAFFLVAIVAAIVSWMLVLMRSGSRAARSETHRQTRRLMDEIEAHKQTDDELKKAKEVAEAANFAKSRYVVGLSHELRTPLNSIMGYAQLLERDEELPSRSRRRVDVMKRSAHHLAGLIDGLLDISKIEAGKLDLARDEVAPRAFLGQLIDMFKVQAEAKGIAFVADLARDLPETTAVDEKRLRQVLINLLSNAIKFTQSGEVSLKVTYRNEVAQFLVSDTGPGIRSEDLERIFLPFERLQASGAEPGTGLGLTISRLLAGVMGGELRVTSAVGAGSTFALRLFLPRLTRRSAETSGRTITRASGRGRTVLLADDNPEHRAMIAEALSPYGFIVLTAEDGTRALEIARAANPDLYVLDIEMPGLNGWQLAEAIREHGASEARIVMLSASAMEDHRRGLAGAFHDAFLMKPVDIALLVETLAAFVDAATPSERMVLAPSTAAPTFSEIPSADILQSLVEDAEIGYIRGLRDKLAEIARDPALQPFADHMLQLAEDMDMAAFIAAIETACGSAD